MMCELSSDLVSLANNLLTKFGCQPYINDASQCNQKYFVEIYEAMLGESLPGLTHSPTSVEDEIHNVQVVIDSLATDVLGVDLSHIDAQSIVSKNQVQIQNLLEIFDGLLEFVLEELEGSNEKTLVKEMFTNTGVNNDGDDSNLLPDDHAVLSDVFQEEFGHSYCNAKDQQKKMDQLVSPGKAFQKEMLANHSVEVSSMSSADRFTWSENISGSTFNLIKEAEIIEKQDADQCNGYHGDVKESPVENLQEDAHLPSCSMEQWGSILDQTSSAANSITALKEIGQRPRKQLPAEKRKAHENKRSINIHKHMHHHFHHHQNDSSTYSESSSNSSSFTSSTIPSSSVIEVDPILPDKKSQSQQYTVSSTEMSTKKLMLVDSSVQTETGENKPMQSSIRDSKEATMQSSIRDSKETSITSSVGITTETRSKQLSDLHERLKKIRNEFPSSRDETEHKSAEVPNVVKGNVPSKLPNRVSFAVDQEEHEFYSSDTEIDYSLSFKKRGKSNAKSIIRKTLPSDSSNSDDTDEAVVDFAVASKSITGRFEEPFLRRDERLLDLRRAFRQEKLENQTKLKRIHGKYSKQHSEMVHQKENLEKQSNLLLKEHKNAIKKSFKTGKKTSLLSNQTNNQILKVYDKPRGRRTEKLKQRKRSASASPVRRRGKAPMILDEDEILPVMEEEFPFIYLSPHSAKLMWNKQMQQVNTLRNLGHPHKSSKTQRRLEEAQRKQEALTRIMKKELEHNKRLKDYKEKKQDEVYVKRKLDERRQKSARARRYYEDYVLRNRARMVKKRTKEEKIFKQLFEDGLEIQKQRIREMREYAKEKQEKIAEKQRNEIESLENYYRDQFSMLAESVAKERYELEVREKAQAQVVHKMRSEMRKRMEKDIQDIQEQLTNDDDGVYFRQLDADNLKREFQLATYRASRPR